MRWVDPETTVAPTVEPVTLDQAKVQVRVEPDISDHDTKLDGYRFGAVGYIEQVCGIHLAPQTVVLRAWDLDCSTFVLPIAPVQSITSITYLDADGARQTLDPALYTTALYGLTPTVSRAFNEQWPAHRCALGSIEITVVAGYAYGLLPDPIRQAALLIIGDWFENTEQASVGKISAIPMVAVESLLANFRRNYV